MNLHRYADNPVYWVDPLGLIPPLAVIVIGAVAGYGVDKGAETYKETRCTKEGNNVNASVPTAIGAAQGALSPTQTKPRVGISGGGSSGMSTSAASQINHDLAKSGAYSTATRNGVTSVLRGAAKKAPYVSTVTGAYTAYDAGWGNCE
jgi:hypothetical protein